MNILQKIINYRYQRYLFHIQSLPLLTNGNHSMNALEPQNPTSNQKEPQKDSEPIPSKKGHGGGKNTNREGKGFEALTDYVPHLLEQGFEREVWNKTSKYGFALYKNIHSPLVENAMEKGGAIDDSNEKRILYLCQGGFKSYMEKQYGLNYPRNPDEAYLLLYKDGRKVMKILEKKAQSVEGSADTKLMAANAFREEYLFFSDGQFEVEYAFCLSGYFKEKFHSTAKKNRKYLFLRQLLKREGIEVFYGEDADYFERLGQWIHRDSIAR